jgi:hypothetical protein
MFLYCFLYFFFLKRIIYIILRIALKNNELARNCIKKTIVLRIKLISQKNYCDNDRRCKDCFGNICMLGT